MNAFSHYSGCVKYTLKQLSATKCIQQQHTCAASFSLQRVSI